MKEIAAELGYRSGLWFVTRTLVMFALAVLCANACQLLLWHVSGAKYPVIHAASWALWFWWQGWLFPRARERYLAHAEDRAYAIAFYRQIWPGVSIGVSHMTLPVLSSLAHPSGDAPMSIALGVVLIGGGAAMMLAATRGGSAQALKAELAESQPELLRFFERMVPPMYGKAYRWAPELDEIAGFVGTERPEGAIFTAAATFYEEIAADVAGDNRETAALDSFLKK